MKGGVCTGGMKGGAESCGVMGGRGRSRRMRGGMFGVTGNAITAGALEYGGAYTGAADPKTGAAVPDPALKGTPLEGSYTGLGGRRRSRKSRKGKKGSKRTRKMRGGAEYLSAQNAGYGFTGTGSAGLANATPTSSNPGNAF